MPVVVMPAQTAERLKPRLLKLAENMDIRMYFAKERVLDLQFTPDEIEGFSGETGPAVVVAVPELTQLNAAIPVQEGERLNYIEVTNEQAVAKLDPFAQ